ncbi:uncharacterized protein N7503_002316 [Penicillium pulvis]|uniref:uncharacterized protein n=1 Tax=Penicillium pulvis TaxID=1562058 RepID=UPI002547A789|nr:uncharacterized protein N7503_002316 [Penicillium pulvis]KAJ5810098.1 hypothetical protein N7503_002316 [Penicillium pulvis]
MPRRKAKYDEEACKDAVHGSRIPKDLSEPCHRLCTIRGIRHHYGFAKQLRGIPEFTRALNARDFMSGIIPTISQPDEIPYCIWYPEVPTGETLRALVQRYPDMLYHAARACAVAGYIDLYKELDPLPEVHIAEEAGYASMQKDSTGSRHIYQHILSQPVKFEIMNDYTRTVDVAGRRAAFLNGDTAVYSSLTARRKYYSPKGWFSIRYRKPWDTYCSDPHYFNITEDWGIDDHDCDAPEAPEDYVPLVYSPLPADLPLINKDKLIHVAAYNGDIDRYARLRRPQMLEHEGPWRAINARRIMSNDLSWLSPDNPGAVYPDLIWYPELAHSSTYEKLAHKRPGMFDMCLRACIVANKDHTWDSLLRDAFDICKSTGDDEPKDPKLWWLSKYADRGLWKEAGASSNKHYQDDNLAAVPDAAQKFQRGYDWWRDYHTAGDLYFPDRDMLVQLFDPVHAGSTDGPYDGMGCGIGDVDLALFLGDAISRETWKKEIEDEEYLLAHLYEIWDLLDLELNS